MRILRIIIRSYISLQLATEDAVVGYFESCRLDLEPIAAVIIAATMASIIIVSHQGLNGIGMRKMTIGMLTREKVQGSPLPRTP